MSNIFENANLGVQANSFTIKSDNPMSTVSDATLANNRLREMKIAEENARIQDRIDNIENEHDKKSIAEKIVRKSVMEAQLPIKINDISVQGKNFLFKEILFELFNKSLVVDDYFLEENSTAIKFVTDKYIDDNGGFKLLENAIRTTDSNLLKKIKSICESTANKVCDKKIKEFHECGDSDCLKFKLEADDKEEFDYCKGELNIDKISELVKDKVLTVIQDEKNREEEEHKIIEEIEEDLTENEDVKDDETLDEAFNRIIIGKTPVREATLFNALFRSSYKEALTENVAIQSTDHKKVEDDRDFSETYDTNATIKNIMKDNLEDGEHDIEEDEINTNLTLESALPSEINMDMILVEAITKYTLMEMLYTLKLENYSRENIAKLTHKLVN